jgi:hypothetical protein
MALVAGGVDDRPDGKRVGPGVGRSEPIVATAGDVRNESHVPPRARRARGCSRWPDLTTRSRRRGSWACPRTHARWRHCWRQSRSGREGRSALRCVRTAGPLGATRASFARRSPTAADHSTRSNGSAFRSADAVPRPSRPHSGGWGCSGERRPLRVESTLVGGPRFASGDVRGERRVLV